MIQFGIILNYMWKAIILSSRAGNLVTFCHFSPLFINLSLLFLSLLLLPLHPDLLLHAPGGETEQLQL